MKPKKSPAQLRAMAFHLVDLIMTRAQPLIDAGMDRDKAVAQTIVEMAE